MGFLGEILGLCFVGSLKRTGLADGWVSWVEEKRSGFDLYVILRSIFGCRIENYEDFIEKKLNLCALSSVVSFQ